MRKWFPPLPPQVPNQRLPARPLLVFGNQSGQKAEPGAKLKVQGSVPEGKSDGERRARKQMQVEARPRWPHATKTMPDAQLAGLRAEVRWNHHILELLVTGRKGTEFICRFPLSLDSHLSKLVPRGFSAPSLPVVPPPPQVAVGQPSSVPSARWQG